MFSLGVVATLLLFFLSEDSFPEVLDLFLLGIAEVFLEGFNVGWNL